jgi:hypothetical protein
LYLAAIIPGEVLFVHGGISSKIKDRKSLENPTPDIELDILWSDPADENGEQFNNRGAGVEFGQDVTKEVCRRLDVKRIVRSHEPKKASDGPCYEHDGRVITTNGTGVYGGKPFLLVIDMDDISEFSVEFV